MTAATFAGPRPMRIPRRAPCIGTDARETERQLLVRYHEHGDLAAREELVRALPAARPRPRAPLHVHRRAARRPRAGREPRPDQGDRPLRARPRHEVHELRRADDPRRAEAPLPRQGLVAARAARPPGAHARGEPRDGGALHGARPLAERARGGRASGLLRRSRCWRRRRPRRATRPPRSTRRRRATTTSRPRSWTCSAARTRPTSSSRTARRSPARGPTSRTSSARSLELRFMQDLTQREIGERIGYSQMHVSRLLRRALNASGDRRSRRLSDSALSDGEALPVVVEVDEHLGPAAPLGDSPGPLVQLRLRVVAAPAAVAVVQPDERPVRRQLVRLEGPARVVGDHERGAVGAQLLVDGLREPALVAELEAVAPGRQQRQRARRAGRRRA